MTDKKVIVVTGSSSGIGLGITKLLAEKGYAVFVTYHQEKEKGEKAVKEITEKGGEATLVEVDVKSEDSVKKLFELVNKKYGKLDVLVNNAGIEKPNPIEKLNFKDWNDVVLTKINGHFLCTKYAIPLLKRAKISHIFNIVSSLGERPDPDYPAYCVGTAGTIAFTKMMAVHLGKYGIRVNGIALGTTKTPMWDTMGGDDEKMWQSFAKNNPLGRVSTPQDIAKIIWLLLTQDAEYLNGNIIYVNGGGHLKGQRLKFKSFLRKRKWCGVTSNNSSGPIKVKYCSKDRFKAGAI